jgi:hypothetical protein
MFIIDGILLLPARGISYVFREIQNAAVQEARRQQEAIRRELSELYKALEKKEITEEEFGVREQDLLALVDEGESTGTETGEGSRRGDRERTMAGKAPEPRTLLQGKVRAGVGFPAKEGLLAVSLEAPADRT